MTSAGTGDAGAPPDSLAAFVARHRGALLALWCALLFFVNLGAAPLTDVDEGAFSEATREMLARGDFVTTYLNGELRFDKPILTYWLQAAPVALFGPLEWAFRLPSALAACLWAWLLYRFARRYAPHAAALATFMLASALGPFLIARSATADALLNAFVAGSLFAFYRHLSEGSRKDLVAAFAWMGLGVLTKGPVALAIPALAVGAYCASRREWLRPFSLLRDPLAWTALLAIAAPWYVLEYIDQGERFIDGFVLKHNVDRYTATMLGHGGHLGYYLVMLPLLVLPFLAPLAGALVSIRQATRDDVQRFAWCAFGVVFVFFSLSRTQLPHYLLYGTTPLFLLFALHRGRFAHPFALIGPAAGGLALAAALPSIAATLASRAPNALARELAADLGASLSGIVLPALGALALLVVAGALAARQTGTAKGDALLVASGTIPALFMVLVLWPRAVSWFQAPVVEAAAFARTRSEPVVEWNANWPSFSVYRGAVTPVRKPSAGEIVLTRADRLRELPPHEILFSRREVVLAKVSKDAP